MVEFALSSLLLLTLTFGLIEFGRAVYQRAALANAAREAGRYGAISANLQTNPGGMAPRAASTAPPLGLTAANLGYACDRWVPPTVSPSRPGYWSPLPACADAEPGDSLRVQLTHSFGFTAPRLIGLSSIAMTDSVRVTIQ